MLVLRCGLAGVTNAPLNGEALGRNVFSLLPRCGPAWGGLLSTGVRVAVAFSEESIKLERRQLYPLQNGHRQEEEFLYITVPIHC